jgi:methylthioribose-1-phosphate isomerase
LKDLRSLGLKVEKGKVLVLDQTRLPAEERWVEARTPKDMAEIIRALQVRGAPLIGVAAALSIARCAESRAGKEELLDGARRLREARPTAVNLMAAVDRMISAVEAAKSDWREAASSEAEAIFEEDVEQARRMAENGAEFIEDGDSVLTHCNTGGLATAGVGTALGAIRVAHEQGKKIHVFVDETRPLLQGARLTTWECRKLGIPFTLICDGMAGTLMRQDKVRKVLVGADRIAANGDFANKIGTYSLAVLAEKHGIPFYCVAPRTTVDLSIASGSGIPIEQRDADEVRRDWSPSDSPVYNPAFDVTPADLLERLVLDVGVFAKSALKAGALTRRLASPSRA